VNEILFQVFYLFLDGILVCLFVPSVLNNIPMVFCWVLRPVETELIRSLHFIVPTKISMVDGW
jgi:hypothetical protein